jgi:hypothetical protein
MATTSNTYTGNGSNKLFSITFPYLATSDVDVYLNGTLQTITTEYTFANATTVEFVAAPANGAVVLLDRSTDDSDNPATFFPGSSIKAADLNDNFDQTLYVVQEINNKAVKVDDPLYANKTYIDAQDATKVNKSGDSMSGNLAMAGNKVTGLGTPSASADAATKVYVDTVTLAGNVPDGDRGDITVSGTGTVWSIDTGAITETKLGTGAVTSAKILDDTIVNADVNASAGIVATKLAFTQAGTGAVARTIDSKLKDMVSVKDFGAVGDGIADDTAAIQAAITANPGKLILIPSGTYKITNTILVAVSGSDAACVRIVGSGSTQTIINNQFAGPAFKFDSGAGAVFAYDVALENLQITSVGSVAGSIGVQLDGCRFARISNVRITSMASHGIYGFSTIGDLTDTAQIEIKQTEISSCGGYGIYAKSDTSAIQYNWNLDQVRVGECTLGGVLYESMVNATVSNSGIFYNNGFGLKVTSPIGGNSSNIIRIENCEFDTNNGTQIYLERVIAVNVSQCYLVGNTGLSQVFSKGIFVDSSVTNVVIENACPRLAPALTGVNVIEVAAGAIDIVARDTNYNGYSVLNGNMYVDNTTTSQLVIDDRQNRNRSYKGTYTVTVSNFSDATVSATTVTGHYAVAGNTVTAGFRNLNNIDLTGFPGSSIIGFTLPKTCILADVGFIGNAIVTSDSGSANPPYPVTTNGSTKAVMQRAGTAAFLTEADLTSSTSDVSYFTLTYIWE